MSDKPAPLDEVSRHIAMMEELKAVQNAEVASRTAGNGLLIVHTGLGKGKSTAAWGLALRALGHGWRVGVVQFAGGTEETGEREAFARFKDQLSWHTMGEGFALKVQDRERDAAVAQAAWVKARELMADPGIRLLILDELNIALHADRLPVGDVIEALRQLRRISESDGAGILAACSQPKDQARRSTYSAELPKGAAARTDRGCYRLQRQAGTDRCRRLRDGDGRGEAPFCRGVQGSGGYRVLAAVSQGPPALADPKSA